MVAVRLALANPGADTVMVDVPVTPSSPDTLTNKIVVPLATGMSIDALPAVVALGATSATEGVALSTCTVTPPCCDAPSVIWTLGLCSPEPTLPIVASEIEGWVTATFTLALVVAITPGMVAESVVEPSATPSNATPPSATDVGDVDAPAGMTTVTVSPVEAVVTRSPIEGAERAIVAVSGTPPAR